MEAVSLHVDDSAQIAAHYPLRRQGVSGARITGEKNELTLPILAALQLSSIYVHNKLLGLRRRLAACVLELRNSRLAAEPARVAIGGGPSRRLAGPHRQRACSRLRRRAFDELRTLEPRPITPDWECTITIAGPILSSNRARSLIVLVVPPTSVTSVLGTSWAGYWASEFKGKHAARRTSLRSQIGTLRAERQNMRSL
jgi:hypothetical protein